MHRTPFAISVSLLLACITPPVLSFVNMVPAAMTPRNTFSSTLQVSVTSTDATTTTTSTTVQQQQQQQQQEPTDVMPELGEDGVYHILNQEQHAAFFASPIAKDKIVVLKCFAPWCRACKGLEPKFLQMVHDDEKYGDLPIQWASLSIQHNKAFVKSLGVLALPTIQFYVAGQLVDTFACGPSKVPMLKRKLDTLIHEHVCSETRQVKPEYLVSPTTEATTTTEDRSKATTTTTPYIPSRDAVVTQDTTYVMTESERMQLRNLPYFKDLSLADLDELLDHKAKLLTFEDGSLIMREGQPGRTFYVLQSGEVEICQASAGQGHDPLVATPSYYLGTVIQRLDMPGQDYFGERALITGEPRVASIRAVGQTKCWAWDKDDFPASSVLSGKTRGSSGVTDDMVLSVNDKYGVSYWAQPQDMTKETAVANQVRGSVNTPQVIRGVDTEEDVVIVEADETTVVDGLAPPPVEEVPYDNDAILSLLTRVNLIRNVKRCFEYIVQSRASWGDEGIRQRRLMLVSRLSPAKRAEFVETFQLVDASADGFIELIELKRVMESIGETKSDDELMDMIRITGGNNNLDGRSVMTQQDFLGLMAETEFYHLFRDVFSSLDTTDSGYVKARDLDRVLSGVRDLIRDDHGNHRRRSLIDVEDQDMLIDYEQFTRMLLGSALV